MFLIARPLITLAVHTSHQHFVRLCPLHRHKYLHDTTKVMCTLQVNTPDQERVQLHHNYPSKYP